MTSGFLPANPQMNIVQESTVASYVSNNRGTFDN